MSEWALQNLASREMSGEKVEKETPSRCAATRALGVGPSGFRNSPSPQRVLSIFRHENASITVQKAAKSSFFATTRERITG